MVSIREIKRIVKEESTRGIKADALEEFSYRSAVLLKHLVKLTSLKSGQRGGENTRISRQDVQLAFLQIMDEVKEE